MKTMDNKKEYKEYAKELNLLLNRWDPIGVSSREDGVKDEYECFIPPIFTVLRSNLKKDDLINVLSNHLLVHVGLPKGNGELDDIAKKIIKWWGNRKLPD